jgi:hypothetical protein
MIRELFNTPIVVRREIRAAPPRDLQPGGPAAPAHDQTSEEVVQREGAFVTVQSLASFPGAVAAVILIVKFAVFVIPALSGNRWIYVGAAAVIGLAIYTINEGDPKAPAKTGKQRALAIGIAVLNTFVILSSAVAIDAKVSPATHPQANPPSTAPSTPETNDV